tara:strand:+ start:5679 stop:7085 length:1407 start_codon:yes stop_codon:yes gene_type:complete
MIIEQIYTGCLAQGAYYIESKGEVAIIDPLREVEDYLERASKNKAVITYIFETHFHADFVSGHLTLAEKTGAKIVFGPNAQTKFDSYIAKDGEVFNLGDITITAIHTPGHTMESTTYLLKDENEIDIAIFTGDTLFLGDVGRPDLAQKSRMSQEDLAAVLFDSLRSKIMPLADDITVYPAHGAGSACGKNLSKETIGTLGDQKLHNYALREDMTKDEFVKEVTEGLLPPPAYFPLNVALNKEGYKSIDEVIKIATKSLSVDDFELVANEKDAVIIDVRHQSEFIKGFIPQSIFIGLGGTFAPWVGALVKDIHQPILLVVPDNMQKEAITRLSRVGFDNVLGYLSGGFKAWEVSGKEIDTLQSVSAEFLAEQIIKEPIVFDVRKPGEYEAEHIENVPSTPLDFLNDHISEFPINKDFYVHCAGGYRSVIAASILKARGYSKVIDVAGGYGAIKKTNIKRTQLTACSNSK